MKQRTGVALLGGHGSRDAGGCCAAVRVPRQGAVATASRRVTRRPAISGRSSRRASILPRHRRHSRRPSRRRRPPARRLAPARVVRWAVRPSAPSPETQAQAPAAGAVVARAGSRRQNAAAQQQAQQQQQAGTQQHSRVRPRPAPRASKARGTRSSDASVEGGDQEGREAGQNEDAEPLLSIASN